MDLRPLGAVKEEMGGLEGLEGWDGWPLGARCICMDECFMDEALCNVCVRASGAAAFSMQTAFLSVSHSQLPGFALTQEIYTLYIPPCQSQLGEGRAAQPSLK